MGNSNIKLLSELSLYMHQFGVFRNSTGIQELSFLGRTLCGQTRAEWPITVDELVSERLDLADPGGEGGRISGRPAFDN